MAGVTFRCCALVETPIVFPDSTREVRSLYLENASHYLPVAVLLSFQYGTESFWAVSNISIHFLIIVVEKIKYWGIALEYLDLLQEKLGFSCSSFELYKPPGENDTGFNAFISEMESCTVNGEIKNSTNCKCSLGVAGWMRNADRNRRVDFLPPFALDDLKVMVNLDDTTTTNSAAFFLSSFGTKVWVSIAGLAVLFTFLKLLDRRFAPLPKTFVPLPDSEPKFQRYKHYLLHSKIPFRLRRAVQSTGQSNFHCPLSKVFVIKNQNRL